MAISGTHEQEAWLGARVASGDFASIDEAARQLNDERIPSSLDSFLAADLLYGAGRIDTPAWKETADSIVGNLNRQGPSEALLEARVSGDESVLYAFARRFPDEPQAREVWAVFEANYREECASILRDARCNLEQRAASRQQKIEAALKSFANDFEVWLERERRGETSPKPSLNTLLNIWLKRGPAQEGLMKPDSDASLSDANGGEREAQLSEERQRADEAAKAGLPRAELAEAESGKARAQFDARRDAFLKAETAGQSKFIWRPAILVAAIVSAFGLGILAGPSFHSGQTETPPPQTIASSESVNATPTDQSSSPVGANIGTLGANDELLKGLLEADRNETVSRVIGYDARGALAKLLEIVPEDVVKASASKMPALAVSEALKASVSRAMIPIAQLPLRDLFKALEPAMSPAKVSELAGLLQAPLPSSGANYKTYDNLEIESRDVTKLRHADLQNCISVCRQKTSCKAYTFDKWNHVCYLKSDIGDFKVNPRSSSGLRDDVRVPGAPSGEITMERYRLKAFPGYGYKTTRADGPKICESACRTDEACVAYTFYFDEKSCWLFNSTGEYFNNRSAESGGKRRD